MVEFRNWASVDQVKPLDRPSSYRSEWNIDREHVALYSGNIANKQGVEIIVEAAERLKHRKDLMFVVCGNGPNRDALIGSAAHLDNIRFDDLQPASRLSELLGLASVHLLPQIAGVADHVLPSKLTNMLASGRPIIATAGSTTGLAREVEGCGIVTEPGDVDSFVNGIERLLDDSLLRMRLGNVARQRAEERWSKVSILKNFEAQLLECAGEYARGLKALRSEVK